MMCLQIWCNQKIRRTNEDKMDQGAEEKAISFGLFPTWATPVETLVAFIDLRKVSIN